MRFSFISFLEYPGFNNSLKRKQGNDLSLFNKRDLTVIKVCFYLYWKINNLNSMKDSSAFGQQQRGWQP